MSHESPRPHAHSPELGLLGDRLSHLEGEVEALQEHAEHLGRQEARVRELEGTFLNFRCFLED